MILYMKELILSKLREDPQTKVRVILLCTMVKSNPAIGEETRDDAHFSSRQEAIYEGTDLEEVYQDMKDKILESFASYQKNGSGWRFETINKLKLNISKNNLIKGSSYIPLPKKLNGRKAIINMKNDDQQCFKWSIARAFNPAENHSERVTKKLQEQAEEFNWKGVNFPTSFSDIDRFEKNNKMSVVVLGYDVEDGVSILRVPKEKNEKAVTLLLIKDEKGNKHYCLVKSLSRLLSYQVSEGKRKRHFCYYCLNGFNTEISLMNHMEYCLAHDYVKTEFPEKGKNDNLEFTNHKRMYKVPFVIYADFECFTKSLDNNTPSDANKSYTNQYQKHEPSGFCYYVKCFDDSVYDDDILYYSKESDNDDVAQIFINNLEETVEKIYKFKYPKKIIYRKEDKENFEKSTLCYVCKGNFDETKSKHKVRDHCHLTRKYRGAAHNVCNLKRRTRDFIPVIFHNLEGYDSHLFIKNLGVTEGNINCIPKNEEKYISFSKGIVVDTFMDKKTDKMKNVKRELRFIDSFKFMSSSLGKLADNLNREKFHSISNYFQGKKQELLLEKGVYPYDYVDCLDKLNEKELPPKEAFYSLLNDESTSDEDYNHAKKVWKEFGMKSMRDYHDTYLMSDVLILADVFESFRKVCLNNYKLDLAWYYTSPGVS